MEYSPQITNSIIDICINLHSSLLLLGGALLRSLEVVAEEMKLVGRWLTCYWLEWVAVGRSGQCWRWEWPLLSYYRKGCRREKGQREEGSELERGRGRTCSGCG